LLLGTIEGSQRLLLADAACRTWSKIDRFEVLVQAYSSAKSTPRLRFAWEASTDRWGNPAAFDDTPVELCHPCGVFYSGGTFFMKPL
jgi:hypothetical protein